MDAKLQEGVMIQISSWLDQPVTTGRTIDPTCGLLENTQNEHCLSYPHLHHFLGADTCAYGMSKTSDWSTNRQSYALWKWVLSRTTITWKINFHFQCSSNPEDFFWKVKGHRTELLELNSLHTHTFCLHSLLGSLWKTWPSSSKASSYSCIA